MDYRKHLQAFIDRWRYNANRGKILRLCSEDRCLMIISAAQAQMKIKILEKVRTAFYSYDYLIGVNSSVARFATSRTRGDGTIQVRILFYSVLVHLN